MEEEVKYCKNCKRDISAKNYVIHTVHCERKIQLCDRCSEPVPRSELEKHEEEFHSNNTCSECGISVEKWQVEKHKVNMKKTCSINLLLISNCFCVILLNMYRFYYTCSIFEKIIALH
ncbi:hypothetical protein AVEN_119708-1 [Araneus ventricosus]|uniref:TRAF-type domain-containing protein n=1 Tax=Araneus ventricosus TaxID=182803 RepID=A0A4Y2C8M4_ARAVE|nr:hypothetical protein AVEN_119708-1 [Araneus ventricosus]